MSILDQVEKIGKIQQEKEKDKTPPGLLLAISYSSGENEYFYAKRKAAIETVIAIEEILMFGKFPKHIVINNNEDRENCVGEKVDDFRGIILIDENIRTVRLIDPEELAEKAKEGHYT